MTRSNERAEKQVKPQTKSLTELELTDAAAAALPRAGARQSLLEVSV